MTCWSVCICTWTTLASLTYLSTSYLLLQRAHCHIPTFLLNGLFIIMIHWHTVSCCICTLGYVTASNRKSTYQISPFLMLKYVSSLVYNKLSCCSVQQFLKSGRLKHFPNIHGNELPAIAVGSLYGILFKVTLALSISLLVCCSRGIPHCAVAMLFILWKCGALQTRILLYSLVT